MQTPGIKSKPIYTPLEPDPGGVHHLLVGHGRGAEALGRLYRGFGGLRISAELHYARGLDPGDGLIADLNRLEIGRSTIYETVDGLLSGLPSVLDGCEMGTRLYVAGSEAFLWRVTAIGRDFGMGDDEIRREHCESQARQVYCVHCKAIADGVRTNLIECAGCGITLFVRDHYSRRLAAYMGVNADAEAPGELPEREVLYS